MSEDKPYRLMVFSWNTESIRISGSPSNTFWNYMWSNDEEYNYPDFFPELVKIINEKDPDIIVIGFQEDRKPGSYFHSKFLVEEMPKIGFNLVKRTRLIGAGVTTYKNGLNGDGHLRGIRLSIYAKSHLVSKIALEEISMRNNIGNDGQSEYVCSSMITRSKGAVASYLILPGMERIVFICAHLPFSSKSLEDCYIRQNPMLRQNVLNHSNIAFNNIIEELVLNKDPVPNHVIYFGDLNYRINNIDGASTIANLFHLNHTDKNFLHDMYINYDELKDQMKRGNIYDFSEGVDNKGPLFLPTCKMTKHRTFNTISNLWKLGKNNQRSPSWCDRILYQYFGTHNERLVCSYYDRFDKGVTMTKSDHAAVIAIFDHVK